MQGYLGSVCELYRTVSRGVETLKAPLLRCFVSLNSTQKYLLTYTKNDIGSVTIFNGEIKKSSALMSVPPE